MADLTTSPSSSHLPALEAFGWARLASEVTDGLVTRPAHHLHRAVADRVFRAVGPASVPSRLVHDTIAEGVYATVRGSLRGMGVAAGVLAAHRARAHSQPWHERSRAGSRLAAVAHGLVGDLAAVAPALDLPLVIRQAGQTVAPRPADLAVAFPEAGQRVAVFLHGLAEDDTIWGPSSKHPERVCLPQVFATVGLTPVRVRYGTGTAVGRNGAALAELLEQLVAAWPVDITQLVLVGHSMGGLVARSACTHAAQRGHGWTDRLDHIAYLGVPHFGAPLEQLVDRTVRLLGRIPEAAPFTDILDRRPPGVRDLLHGTLSEQIDELADVVEPVADDPWLEGVDHHLIVGRLARSERHPLNRVVGDLLVTAPSATGRARRRRIEGERVHVVPVVANHFGLCWHPRVADHLLDHLAARSGPDTTRPADGGGGVEHLRKSRASPPGTPPARGPRR